MNCPCKNCEFRHIKCHAECEPYKTWLEEKKTNEKPSLQNYKFTEFLMDQIEKQKRYTNKHKRK